MKIGPAPKWWVVFVFGAIWNAIVVQSWGAVLFCLLCAAISLLSPLYWLDRATGLPTPERFKPFWIRKPELRTWFLEAPLEGAKGGGPNYIILAISVLCAFITVLGLSLGRLAKQHPISNEEEPQSIPTECPTPQAR